MINNKTYGTPEVGVGVDTGGTTPRDSAPGAAGQYTKPAKQIYPESTSDATIMVDPDDVVPFAIDPLVQSPQSAARAKRPLE